MAKVPARYRLPLKLLVWMIAIVSFLLGFFTLSLIVAAPVAVVALIAPWLISKLVFEHHIVWVMPPFSPEAERNRLGTIWFKEPLAGKEYVGLGLLYEDREWAKDAYNVIKTWNFGRLIDTEGNINITIVSEGDHKYSMFVYPGLRPSGEKAIRDSFLATQPASTAASVSRLFYFTNTCADYSDRPQVEGLVATLGHRNRILLNTFYCSGDEVHPHSKRYFQVNRFRFEERNTLATNCPEYHSPWWDGRIKDPDSAKRTDQLASKLFGSHTKTNKP